MEFKEEKKEEKEKPRREKQVEKASGSGDAPGRLTLRVMRQMKSSAEWKKMSYRKGLLTRNASATCCHRVASDSTSCASRVAPARRATFAAEARERLYKPTCRERRKSTKL